MTPQREHAVRFYNLALEVLKTDAAHAYRLFCSAVSIDPTFPEGWITVSNANGDLGLLPSCLAAARIAHELAPDNIAATINLGHRLYHSGKNDEARYYTMKALEMDPENAFAWCNLSLIQTTDGQTEDAVVSARMAFERDQSAMIEFALALAYMNNRQWSDGFRHMESKFAYRLQAYANYLNYPYQRWQGEDIEGKTLLVVAEQGLGDTLSFLRFIPFLKNCTVELQIQAELVKLVGMMFPPGGNITVGPLTQVLPQADYWCSITSIPFALGLTNDEIETAKAPPIPYTSLGATTPWKVQGRKFHIGIAWAGSPANDIDRHRSFTIDQMLDLCKVPNVQLYSLQIGERSRDLHAAGAQAMVKDLAPFVRDFADTAAIMRDLDLLIVVESAQRHLAGLLGCEAWVPYAWHGGGDYRCGRHEDHPLWDARTKLFRQGPDGTWPPVFDRIVAELRERVN